MKKVIKNPNHKLVSALEKLAKRWRKESAKTYKIAAKERKYAGQSHDEKGTGDEGWHKNIEDCSFALQLEICAKELEDLIEGEI